MLKVNETPNINGSPHSLYMSGIRIDFVANEELRHNLLGKFQLEGCHHIVTANIDYLQQASQQPLLGEIINRAALVLPDGAPLIWAAKLRGADMACRITGHTLVTLLAQLADQEQKSLFFLGGRDTVPERAALRLSSRFPSLRIAGFYAPPFHSYPFPAEENEQILSQINRSGADVLLVALGCPKQDMWIADNLAKLEPSIAVGIGSVLDVLSGKSRRAPVWLQNLGLEWLFRLSQEPGRLWRRYLLHDAPFVMRLISGSVKERLTAS